MTKKLEKAACDNALATLGVELSSGLVLITHILWRSSPYLHFTVYWGSRIRVIGSSCYHMLFDI